MNRFRCPAKTMPGRSFADSVTWCPIRPVEQMTLCKTSETRSITPNSDAIFRILTGARPKLDTFKPARGRWYPMLAEV